MPSRFTETANSIASRHTEFRGVFTRSAERRRQDEVINRVTPGCARRFRREFRWRMMDLTENNPQKFATSSVRVC